MVRAAAIAAIVLCISPPLVCAQVGIFTVGVPSAEIHRAPSTGSPVIGTAPRGAVLDVRRELGSWVSVSWPGAWNDEAFVHVSRGVVTRRAAATGTVRTDDGPDARSVADEVGRVERSVLQSQQSMARTAPPATTYVVPAHTLGVGGLLGGRAPAGFGATGRLWRGRGALQLVLSRYTLESTLGPERLTLLQVEPSALFSPADYVTESVWIRPYVGAGISLRRQTLSAGTGAGASEGAFGLQTFGGGEVTVAGLPQFALSADVGYRWAGTDRPGFDLRGAAFSLALHYYVK